MTRKLRNDFEQNIAKNVIQKPKIFWRYAQSRLNTRQNIPTLENPYGSKATKEKANSLSVEGEISTWSKVTSGIPQGSVIGPLLFVIFINDMPDEVKHNACKLFADD